MKKFCQVFLGLLLGLLFASIIFAGYEIFVGGPWYTYENFIGQRVVLSDGAWVRVVNSILTPFLKVGHFILDHFFM